MVDETLKFDAPKAPLPKASVRGGSCCGTQAAEPPLPKASVRGGSCCGTDSVEAPVQEASGCCAPAPASGRRRIDWLMAIGVIFTVLGYGWHLIQGEGAHGPIGHFAMGVYELMNIMWWGILMGIVAVGLMDRVPREVIISALAGERRVTGILRATAAGVAFDLCSHGILMVGMKLYERGASIGQTVAFLLASPWNSISLTIILIALIGWWYTLLFIVLSMLIGIVTGLIFDGLVARGRLPDNPARANAGDAAPLGAALRNWLGETRFSFGAIPGVLKSGLSGSRMVLRWLLFGIVLAAGIRALVPADIFAEWFGPTMLGVFLTLLAATIIEVCSEGATPIAADLVGRAAAPGNGFVFLMGGVATDYTEIMSIKDTTRSWRIALALPLIAVPQTIIVGIMLNLAA